ncbi:hypothetical protein A2755_02485 [Candidatus Wolfebacteria bacterium RIFCSPHIGHO2_01_FULL_48_22]|uniref:Type II secretion system protein GspG C-terminal domain-containing protein n=2 Tax=Candidatus Wolfeibacteriota TaxID=1752735 RepID=A0A1F8DS69_9BACT|nr:MAG: hypothetical protein A2755_02485 [Candidatus Wolfebacteria bacterium RIFCSPHIGHO2_01_FULL_48_22]OGM92255.1 MAG: hypothetical protein A2935_00585 [Candidatus Wolfebacteria bacterium RIFCSPLOWO2_01_FULL_47_17b]
MKKTGFTLVELLIVIGILAILTAAVVVILNPAELLRQARDSQRFSDLDSVKNAISLYLVDVTDPSVGSSCYMYTGATTTTTNCGGLFTASYSATGSTTRVTDGTGWIPVNFDAISGGSPLSVLPIDPSHGTTYFYAYAGGSTALTFEINAFLESTKYINGGGSDKESTDGGDEAQAYEAGTDLTL